MNLIEEVSDKKILSRFKIGNVIRSEEERKVLMRYADWLCLGLFDYKTRQARASLTDYGRYQLRQMS